MRRLFIAAVVTSTFVAAVAACVGDDPTGTTTAPDSGGTTPGPGDATQADAPADGSTTDADGPRCRDEDPFASPVELANLAVHVPVHVRLPADELEIFFQTSGTVPQIMVARRGNKDVAFEPAQAIDTSMPDASTLVYDPTVSSDGLTLYFGRDGRLAKMTRPSRVAAFGSPSFVGLDEPGVRVEDPHVLGDERALYFVRVQTDGGNRAIWRSANGAAGFDTPTLVSVPGQPNNPTLSDDELTLYYADHVDDRVYRMMRGSTAESFGARAAVDELSDFSDSGTQRPGWVSPDKCRMYFVSGTIGSSKVYLATRKPR